MRAAIYARVSSAAQRDAHTIENQLRTLPAFVMSQGWELAGTYVDDGRSAKTGKLDKRDGFARLMADAEARRFDVLVVVDVDRLTRTGSIEERAQILGPFQRLGIQIVTPSGGALDLRSFLGEFWVTVQALVAAEENRKRAERIKAGKLRAIAEGRKPAGPTPYGLRYDRASSSWSIDPERAAIAREAFARVVAGESCGAIADDLYVRQAPSPRGPWTRHKLWMIVRSRHVVGEWTADKARELVVRVPALVDETTWQRAQDRLIAHGKRGLRRTRHTYLLEGIATCARCGAPIVIRSATSGSVTPASYICRARKYSRPGQPRCGAPIVRSGDVDDGVWRIAAAWIASPKLVAELDRRARARDANRRGWESDLAGWRRRLGEIERIEAALLTRFSRGLINERALDTELARLRREQHALEDQVRAAAAGAGRAANELAEAPAALVARLQAVAAAAGPEERRLIVRKLVPPGGAVLDEGRVRLTLRVEAGSRGAAAGAPIALGVASGYSSEPRERSAIAVELRVVV